MTFLKQLSENALVQMEKLSLIHQFMIDLEDLSPNLQMREYKGEL
jgi:hypothetical protein